MLSKIYHQIPAGEAYTRILIIQPDPKGEAVVYVPPVGEEKAYSCQFPDFGEAEDFAVLKAQEIGQKIVLFTRDRVTWWLPE